ncbi:MAG: hypothetical protein IT381_25860 [Deltaproteobacteria bacterium]|nr:hypothetical protein [Deltaproteobacteria bacterium]
MRRLLERTVRGVRHTPGLFVTTTAAVAVSLVLAGAFALASLHLREWTASLVGTETLVAYLRPEVDEPKAAEVARALSALPRVAKVELESPRAAAERLKLVLGAKDDAVLGAALTWSAVVSAKVPGELPDLAAAVQKVAGVDEVDFGAAVYERLQAIERVAVGFGIALLILVLSVCAFVVNIAVSLALFVRREEIAVQRIVGASDGFVLLPLLVENAISGLAGGLLALFVLYSLFSSFVSRYAGAIVALGVSPPRFFDGALATSLVLAGAAIACAGALVASLRHLRQAE